MSSCNFELSAPADQGLLLQAISSASNLFLGDLKQPHDEKHVLLLMEESLHQLIGSLSHYLQGFIHPRWLAGFQPSTASANGRVVDRISPSKNPPNGVISTTRRVFSDIGTVIIHQGKL